MIIVILIGSLYIGIILGIFGYSISNEKTFRDTLLLLVIFNTLWVCIVNMFYKIINNKE